MAFSVPSPLRGRWVVGWVVGWCCQWAGGRVVQSGAQLRQSVTDQSTTEATRSGCTCHCRWKWKATENGKAVGGGQPKGRQRPTFAKRFPPIYPILFFTFCLIFLFKNYWLLIHFEPVRHSYFCCSPEWVVLRHAHCGAACFDAHKKKDSN